MKKRVSIFIAFVFVLTTFLSFNILVSANTKKTDEAFSISVASWMLGDTSPNAKPFMDYVEKTYKAKYPNATVVWNPIQGEKYHDMLKAQLATGTAPDVFFFQNAIVPFGKAGYLADLSGQSWAGNILASTKADVMYNGKLLAAPIDVAGWGVYYNKKVFKSLGIVPPKTFTQFLAICQKIKAKGIIPMTGGYKEWQAGAPPYGLQSIMYGVDNNIGANLYNGKTKVNGPAFRALFRALESMVKAGAYPKSILSTTYQQAQQQIGEGKAAMIFDGPWLCPSIAKDYKGTDLGFFVIPDAKGNISITSSVNQAVALNAAFKDKQKGLDMINVIVSKPAVQLLLADSSFAGMKGYNIAQNTTGAKEYNDALNKYTSRAQFSALLPPSTYDLLTQITTKIIAGKAFDPKDLDPVDTAYQRDKNLINLVK